MKVAIILKSPEFNEEVKEEFVIYADAGYKHLNAVGNKKILAVVGDFDSLQKKPENQKTVILNREKNYTDGEYAVRYAVSEGADCIVIYGAYGGKPEHVLGNLALLGVADKLGVKAVIKHGNFTTELIGGKTNLTVKKGGTLSLLPFGGDCLFLNSKGLYYPLINLNLTPYDTRGISNVAQAEEVELEIIKGKALAIYENK